jgi:hypothetical protein
VVELGEVLDVDYGFMRLLQPARIIGHVALPNRGDHGPQGWPGIAPTKVIGPAAAAARGWRPGG